MPAITPYRLAVVQLDGSVHQSANLAAAADMIAAAAKTGARVICFPENSNCLCLPSSPLAAELRFAVESEDPFVVGVCQAAAKHGIWVCLGSVLLLSDDDQDDHRRLRNRCLMINDRGQRIARYDKLHLFDVDLADGQHYRESERIRAGSKAVLVNTPFGCFGLTICYDLRFPELFLRLALAGAQIITVPAAFTATTGQLAWHPLLRARAIETGCYIVAAAQHGASDPHRPGKHQDGRTTFGHSLVCDPDGRILVERPAQPGLLMVDIDLNAVTQARMRIPSLAHRRMDFSELPLDIF